MRRLPYGALVLRPRSAYWYWQFIDPIKRYQCYKSTGEKDRARAWEVAKTWALDLLVEMKSKPAHYSSIHLRTVAQELIDEKKQSMKRRSLHSLVSHLYGDGMILAYFGLDKHPAEIRTRHIREFKEYLLSGTPERKALSGRTVNNILSSLSQLLHFAAEMEYIDSVPLVKRAREDRGTKAILITDAQYWDLVIRASHLSWDLVTLLVLARCSLMRSGEICRMCWKHIDWESGWIAVPDQKNRTDMRAPILGSLAILRAGRREEGKVVRWNGRCVRSLRDEWAAVKAWAGLDARLRLHDLIHLGVSVLENSGRFSPAELSLLKRHKYIASTNHYKHAWAETVLAKAKGV